MTAAADDGTQDRQVFALLDSYLKQLHRGQVPDTAALLARHPELAGLVDCLNVLERMAPPRSSAGEPHAAGGPSLPVDLGRYELLEEIGRGGMGVVYKARQKDLDRVVAVKMILASHLASEEQVRRFLAEARSAGQLHHPHITRIHEAGQMAGQPYFAMEYVAGCSLAARLCQGKVPVETGVRWLAAVARAVAHLHARGWVHRDLKPSNILLDGSGEPYVTDFGLMKILGADGQRTSTGVIVGTPGYMAPEQAVGRNEEVGPRSDVYGLGAILYEVLTGRPPFAAANPLETLVQVVEGEPTRPRRVEPGVPRELELICLRCLEKAPGQRYASAAALADDLERFLRGEVVEARPQGLGQQVRRWARREPALVSRLGALAVCAVVIQLNYQLSGNIGRALHLEVMGVLAAWTLSAVIWQRLLGKPRWGQAVRLAWAAADVTCLTGLLWLSEGLGTPLPVGYPVLVAGSGLWFRVRLVWWTTALAEVGYGLLVLDELGRRGGLANPHYHVIFAVALAVLGLVMAYQVKRVRALSRWYEQRPLP